MRIDLYTSVANQIDNESNSKRVNTQNVTASDAESGGDHATLTSGAGSVSALVGQAMSSPAIRHDKVQSLQQAIQSGQYKLDPDQIAGAMIDEHA